VRFVCRRKCVSRLRFSLLALELVTPPLDGMILPGVTRDSVLALARAHASGTSRLLDLPGRLTVSERPVTMKEVKAAAHSGHLVELFGTGKFSLSLKRHHHQSIDLAIQELRL
jgi:branched-subunit amino acid aminotransferase/4-amino-4-deoxychorismate lyase